jgi:hypothetical protein
MMLSKAGSLLIARRVPFDDGTAFLATVPDCWTLLCGDFFKLIMPYTPQMVALWAVAVCKLFFGYDEMTIGATKLVFGRLNKFQFMVLARSHRRCIVELKGDMSLAV